MESRHVSRYYVKRRSKTGSGTQETTYAKYPKVVLVTDCQSHMVLAAVPGRGPARTWCSSRRRCKDAAGPARIGTLLADADFDGEWVHEHVRAVRHPDDHPAGAGPAVGQATGGEVAALDESSGSTGSRPNTVSGGRRRRSTR